MDTHLTERGGTEWPAAVRPAKSPFGWQFGEANGHGRARELVPDEAEQAAIADIVAMREGGRTLMDIRDTLRGQGFAISHQSVANILARREVAA